MIWFIITTAGLVIAGVFETILILRYNKKLREEEMDYDCGKTFRAWRSGE